MDRRITRVILFLGVIGLAACSGSADRLAADPKDPFEAANRKVFAFNMKVDDVLLEPAAKGYRKLPDGVQKSATNFVTWASYPSTALNSTLQGKLENAALAGIHFLVNGLTLGLGDLTGGEDDPEREDFGQTLAAWRLPQGPYVMMPIFGPGTVRSHAGRVVDTLTNPLGRSGEPSADVIVTASAPLGVVTFRGNNFEAFNQVKYNAADPYARTRSIFYQFRDGRLRDGDAGAPSAADETFDSFLNEEEGQ